MTRIAITGAQGAMGTTVREVAANRDDVDVALLVSRGSPDNEAVHPSDLASALDERQIDVLVDFTVPEGSIDLVTTAAGFGVGSVIGTTGFSEAEFTELHTIADTVPLLHAPNFSKGVHTLLAAVSETVSRLPDADIEITETHHNRKRDAPSGTANRILETIESIRADTRTIHGREGDAPRKPGDIGVHARRAGTVTGEHEILVAIDDEEIRLTHRAESRRIFATGALDAAVWLTHRSAGWYDFDDVLS